MPSGTQPRWVQTPSVISQFGLPGLVRSASDCGSRSSLTAEPRWLRRSLSASDCARTPVACASCLDRLARLDLGDVDFGRGLREHVGRRRHLDDQRRQRRDGAHAREADRRDIQEIAATNAVTSCVLLNPQRTVPWWPSSPFDAIALSAGSAPWRRRTGRMSGAIGGPDSEARPPCQGRKIAAFGGTGRKESIRLWISAIMQLTTGVAD